MVHTMYVVLEVYTPGAILQYSPCACSLIGVYTWCNVTMVHPVYVVLEMYTPGAILQWYIL